MVGGGAKQRSGLAGSNPKLDHLDYLSTVETGIPYASSLSLLDTSTELIPFCNWPSAHLSSHFSHLSSLFHIFHMRACPISILPSDVERNCGHLYLDQSI